MKNILGSNLTLTLFGESHGEAIGVVIDGISPGIEIKHEEIERMLTLRRPSGLISTARREKEEYNIVSGVFEGRTTGTPLCIIIQNSDKKSKDYAKTRSLARPGHADYTFDKEKATAYVTKNAEKKVLTCTKKHAIIQESSTPYLKVQQDFGSTFRFNLLYFLYQVQKNFRTKKLDNTRY